MIDSWGTLHFKPTRRIFMVKNEKKIPDITYHFLSGYPNHKFVSLA